MWDNAFPSFLIGLREGLEAGLIVSILVATLVRSGQKSRLPQVWTGVLAAIALAMSFGAVLTFTAANLSATAQEAFGGVLSVIAICFVTAMVFWMRRSARTLSGEIRERVTAALGMGAGVLVLTAFLAVGREGLETALFLWTTAQTAKSSSGPPAGAAAGLALAALLCWGLYRRVLHINLTRFFTCTGIGLIIVASGVLGYGLRDLQEGGVLPGAGAYAWDLSSHIDSGSWYATLVQGVFNVTPRMTWLQVTGYVVYLAVVMPLFIRGSAVGAVPKVVNATPPAAKARRGRPAWAVPVTVVVVPAVVAGAVIAFGTSKPAGAATVSVSPADCGRGFGSPAAGQQTFQLRNTGSTTSEVYLIDPSSSAIYGEVEGLAPGTTRTLTVTIGGGEYAWRCVPGSGPAVTSAPVRVGGSVEGTAFVPTTAADLAKPLAAYKAFIEHGLATLVPQTQALESDIAAGDLASARRDWLTAHLTYSTLGAAYDTFGEFNQEINGRPDGLPDGVHDANFTGFHRVEYGLWHGEAAASLLPPAQRLLTDVKGLRSAFPAQDFDPNSLSLRTHEILENTLQFELSADTDGGSGSNLATAQANVAGTRELISLLTPLINARSPHLVATVDADLARFGALLAAQDTGGGWTPVGRLDLTARQRLDGALGQYLEDVSPVPDLLEIRKAA